MLYELVQGNGPTKAILTGVGVDEVLVVKLRISLSNRPYFFCPVFLL